MLTNILVAKLHAALLNAAVEQVVGMVARWVRPECPARGSESLVQELMEQLQPRGADVMVKGLPKGEILSPEILGGHADG